DRALPDGPHGLPLPRALSITPSQTLGGRPGQVHTPAPADRPRVCRDCHPLRKGGCGRSPERDASSPRPSRPLGCAAPRGSQDWEGRLEGDGGLVSWAVPKGLPLDPKTNHLAKQTEDHPMAYATFAGEIPKGEYGGGSVTVWDSGTYELEKWRKDEVKVVLHG